VSNKKHDNFPGKEKWGVFFPFLSAYWDRDAGGIMDQTADNKNPPPERDGIELSPEGICFLVLEHRGNSTHFTKRQSLSMVRVSLSRLPPCRAISYWS
jgi:hypothetical protein